MVIVDDNDHPTHLIDLGATVSCDSKRPLRASDRAVMGTVFAAVFLFWSRPDPRIDKHHCGRHGQSVSSATLSPRRHGQPITHPANREKGKKYLRLDSHEAGRVLKTNELSSSPWPMTEPVKTRQAGHDGIPSATPGGRIQIQDGWGRDPRQNDRMRGA
jgi:hypothetical protein